MAARKLVPPWAYFFSLSSWVGVGSNPRTCVARLGTVVPLSYFSMRFLNFLVSMTSSLVVGVSNKPNPVPSVGCADTASWKNERLNGVPCIFQVSAHLLEDHPSVPINKPAYVLPHNVARGAFSYNAQHLGPQVALVVFALSLSGEAVWLAREPSADNINSSSVSCRVELADVLVLFGMGKMVFKNSPWEVLPLAIKNVCPTCPFGGQVKPSDT